MPGEERLVTGEVPTPHGSLTGLELEHLVDEQKRGPVGQDLLGAPTQRRLLGRPCARPRPDRQNEIRRPGPPKGLQTQRFRHRGSLSRDGSRWLAIGGSINSTEAPLPFVFGNAQMAMEGCHEVMHGFVLLVFEADREQFREARCIACCIIGNPHDSIIATLSDK